MRKKILSIMLALCLILTMMPMATGVAWAATATEVDIGTVKLNSSNPYYHNGENGSQGYADNVATGANATFSSGTLTLNGLNLTTSGYAIYATADLTIKLEGKNNVKGGNASNNVIYIGYQSSLTITGSESGTASLTVTGGYPNAPTIYAYNNITINGGAQVTAKNTAGVAINAQHGNIEITGQKTTVICSGKDKNALVAGASESGKTVTVSDSATLVAATTSASLGAIKGTVAIAGGNETIMGGTSESDATSLELGTLNSQSSTYKYVYIDTIDKTSYETATVPTAITGLTYKGSTQTGVEAGTGYSLSGHTAKDVGTYTAIATLNDGYVWNDDNRIILDRTIKWSIAKADLNKDFFTFAAPSNCTYDGNAKAAMVTTKDGLTGIGNITVKYYDEAGNKVNEAKNVGTYTVKIDVAEGMNNNAATDLTDSSWTFTIVAPVYNVTITSTTGMTLVSGSESQTGLTGAMTAVVYNAATGYYFPVGYGASLGQNGITVERVNETQIKISGTPTATTAITLAEPSQHPVKPSISVTGTYTYTGEEQTATVTGYVADTMDITGNKGTDAGSYTASVTSKTGKWSDGTTAAVTASWSISPLSVTITPASGLHKTYGEADPELTYSTGLSGAAETAFNSAKSGALARAAGEDANYYAINIGTLAAGTNFTLTLSGSIVNFTIDKATWGVPTETLTADAPTSAANNDGRITGTTTAMQYKLSSESTWTDCSGDITGLAAGTYYVRYKEDVNHNASESAYKTVTVPPYVAPAYDVTVTRATGMTLASGSGSEIQTGLTGAMTAVVYNAATGYYFPEGYGASLGQNGITVERVSETQIKISGTPTATTAITLAEPSQHPVKPSISVTGTYTYTGEEQTATVTGYVTDTMNITGNKGTNAGSYTASVTSKTGKWSDGTTDAVTASWSISPLSVTITPASGLNKTYGEADPELTYSTGLSGAAETAFNSAKSGKLARAAGEDAGTYAINIGTLAAGNNFTLTLSDTPVSFTIDKATWGVPTETLTPAAPTSAANNDGKITGTTSAMQYKLSSESTWNDCSGNITGLAAGTYYVRYKEDANHNASESAYKPVTVPAYSTGSSTGGGSYGPTIQKPTVTADDGAETTLSTYGDKLTIKAADGYEITDVLVNGVSKGKVTELTGLKTGDKVEIKTEKKAEEPKEPTKEEVISMLKQSELVCRSKIVASKNGKKGIRITWADMNGGSMDFDGVEIYRSTKRNSGYGTKPFYETKGGKSEGYYVNTKGLKPGTTYYYKVRGYVLIDGQKYYTGYSLKAIRTLK